MSEDTRNLVEYPVPCSIFRYHEGGHGVTSVTLPMNGWTLSEAVPPGTFTALKTAEDLLYVANLRSANLEREVKILLADKEALEKGLKVAEGRCALHLDANFDQGCRISHLQAINRKLGSENKALAEENARLGEPIDKIYADQNALVEQIAALKMRASEDAETLKGVTQDRHRLLDENDRQKAVIVAQGKKIGDMCRERDQALSAQGQTKAYVDAQVPGACANEIVALKATHAQEIAEIKACQTVAISVLKDAHTKEVSRLRDRFHQEQSTAYRYKEFLEAKTDYVRRLEETLSGHRAQINGLLAP